MPIRYASYSCIIIEKIIFVFKGKENMILLELDRNYPKLHKNYEINKNDKINK